MTTSLDALKASTAIADHYRRYLHSTFAPRRDELRRAFADALEQGIDLSRGPFLEASAPFVAGSSTRELVGTGLLDPGFEGFDDESFPIDRPLHMHQQRAIEKAVEGRRNLVVSTGTGSGKTETFLLPILNQLFRERAAGTLEQPGVRALLLYPMNALANDQVKRLRTLLAPIEDITFGRFVGDTKETTAAARQDFRNRHPGQKPLPNELISREDIRERPPHILLTNYAMLEYLLLRPTDSSLFDGPTGNHWRFIVLDEAHVYDGAQGTEVAMLLRRVRDRVLESEKGQLQCFATSATLGKGREDFPALLDFAEALFDEKFEWDDDDPNRQDIVSAERQSLAESTPAYTLSQTLYRPLQEAFRSGVAIDKIGALVRDHSPEAPLPEDDEDLPRYLGRLLRADGNVIELQGLVEHEAVELLDAASKIFQGDQAGPDMVALIDLCVAARRRADDAPVLPARYHFFVRSLEGAFVCLHPEHDPAKPAMALARHETCPHCAAADRMAKMFELGVCRSCGSEYLVGKLDADGGSDHFGQASEYDSGLCYLLVSGENVDDDEDQLATGVETKVNAERMMLNPTTGDLTGRSGDAVPAGPNLPVTRIKTKSEEPLRRCISCSTRTNGDIVYRFLTGSDAPVSVIATDLYQQLPPSTDADLRYSVGEGRKLLAFSDSRQDAAYFAPYLARTYRRSIERRLIHTALTELGGAGPHPFEGIADRIVGLAEDAMVMTDGPNALAGNRAEAGSWLLGEALAVDRRLSLEGLGLAEIALYLPRRFTAPTPLLELGLAEQEATDLLQLLLSTIVAAGAVTTPMGVDVRDERFAPRNREIGARRVQSEPGVVSWAPTKGNNRRLEILTKIFDRREIDADPAEILDKLWEYLTSDRAWADAISTFDGRAKGALSRVSHEHLTFQLASDDHRPLRCDTCRRVSWRSVADICPMWRCAGSVSPIAPGDELGAENHYARLYQELQPIGMAVEEHTAQWTSSEASQIQDKFIDGEINTLSCTTTFELGVDVGDVQAVLLRNVPPRAANYVQRAGRAGRRTDSAALVVTYAQRRSHDRNHFQDPRPLVNGSIDPPLIMLDNSTILRRHAHSIAFAAYERRAVDAGGEEAAHRTVSSFFGGDEPHDHRFVDWLRTHPSEVGEALARVLPPSVAEAIDVAGWSWVDALVESTPDEPSHGWLERAGADVRGDFASLAEMMADEAAEQNFKRANSLKLTSNTLERRQLLGFLASRNVLPKYGFPVDVVELDLRGSGDADASRLELSRDLRLAIREYAPGGQVIAAGGVWESRGLKKRPDQELPTYQWKVCAECGAFRHSRADGEVADTCDCGEDRTNDGGRAVMPIFGFVGGRAGDSGEGRPKSAATVRTYFAAYGEEAPELEIVKQLSAGPVTVKCRTSRQGRIWVIARPKTQSYRFCKWCGHGEIPTGNGRRKPHKDPRRPDRECDGPPDNLQLCHEFLTDVTEIRLGVRLQEKQAISVLYALLEAAPDLGIARGDVDGTLFRHQAGGSPALILYDAVPGGAGHARRLAQRLPQLFEAAQRNLTRCDCGPETSCYSCLRSYGNQIHHDNLARGDALDVLSAVFHAPTDGRAFDITLFNPITHGLITAATEAGHDEPIPGHELVDPDLSAWMVEAAWPDRRVAILVDRDNDRDRWLEEQGWQALHSREWSERRLLSALQP